MERQLIDRFGRKHDYLRVSVTDRCNLRCVYCMGPEGVPLLKHDSILSYEEIVQVVKAAAELGIKKVRITGGEPLVRKNIADLVEKIAAIPEIVDLSMTTNGQNLTENLQDLKKAGLKRINISLDSLDPAIYKKITRGGDLDKVLTGLRAALDQGLTPVKLNIVLMKGINDGEIKDFLDLAKEYPVDLRFIEYMPIDSSTSDWREKYLSLDYVLEKIKGMGLKIKPAEGSAQGCGPAEMYQVEGIRGLLGLIHPISKHFCARCNRLRLTPDGFLKPCLYWQEETAVGPVINDHLALKELIRSVLDYKREKHAMTRDDQAVQDKAVKQRGMSKTGG